jgi:hypothetical protein
MNDRPQTWHYGLLAQWWAEFNVGGPEIAYYQKLIERFGQAMAVLVEGTARRSTRGVARERGTATGGEWG